MLLVDSTVWIDYFGGRVTPETDHLDRIMPLHPILVGDLILTEVLQGFRSDAEFERAHRALGKFAQVSVVNPDLSVESTRNYRSLRHRGTMVRKIVDCFIATYCIETGRELLHADQDYNSFEKHLGLRAVHPLRGRGMLGCLGCNAVSPTSPHPGSYGPGDAGDAWSGPGGCSVSWPREAWGDPGRRWRGSWG